MTSTLPTHPALVWPRTDAVESRWPDLTQKPGQTWYVPLDEGHGKYKTYEETAGEHLAQKLGLPKLPGNQKHRICLPPGFKIFVHKQPRQNGDLREDFYCFGSKYTQRIRSAQEFKDHAEWLFDTSKPKAGSVTGTPSSAQPSAKRVAPAVVNRPKPPKRPRFSPDSDDEAPTGVVPERASDLSTQRRFRRGELVWLRINAIEPPFGSKPTLPALTHWPALIAEIRHKSHEEPARNANGTGSFANGGMIHHYWQYHLRPLGLFHKAHDAVRDIKDLLPWSVGVDLLGGDPGRKALAEEGARVLARGIDEEVYEDAEMSAEIRWATKWAAPKRFDLMIANQDNWEEVVFRLVIAIRTGTVISQSWCQTDRIEVFPEAILSLADRDAINSNKKSLFQGLWLGGERIWAEDVVRIRHRRDSLPPGLAPVGHGTGAAERAVFMRIQAIALETHVPASDDPKVETWRCVVYGDLAELIIAPPGGEAAADSGWAAYSPTSGVSAPLVQQYKCPRGYMYRQLNPDDSQITCDIGDIAGRAYPDLLDESTQTWYGAQPPRAPAGKKAIAVMGLSPGSEAAVDNHNWAEDLFSIVDRASRTVESSFSQYYAKELEKRMQRDPAKKPTGWKPPKRPEVTGPEAEGGESAEAGGAEGTAPPAAP